MESKERTRLVYENLAWFYNMFRSRNGFSKIQKFLSLGGGMCLLDCGAGPGKYACSIADSQPDATVFGLDICEKFLHIAARRARRRRIDNSLFVGGDVERLPFGDESFDRVLCAGVLLLLEDKEKALFEMYRVLKKTGVLLIVEPRRLFLPWRELYYALVLPIIMKMVSLKEPLMTEVGREDYGGRKFRPDELESLVARIPFASIKTYVKATQMYLVCVK